ncbi:hypothetical protein A3L04_00050 [Thermococcus chitonophagus]|uniref:Uncharacterized protein n=1 Tax=Thermococcus chitonophagus TaxID=54262 RepID=A0A170S8E6_9EURY|nr:hypothetical protein [Thermococcus chitonophagus]ASJ15579.1 hypothetical protein A3L04_00050 [Thermococcus chitonophagus]CUX76784.1 hypothetical protein CHITON_0005 [Thermococcus chitonophagus]
MKMKILVILFMLVVGVGGCISTGTLTVTHHSPENTTTQQPTTTKLEKVWVYVNKSEYNATILVPVNIAKEVEELLDNITIEQIDISAKEEGSGAGFRVYILKFPEVPESIKLRVDFSPVLNGTIVTSNTISSISIVYSGKVYSGNITIKKPLRITKADYQIKFSEIKNRTRLGTIFTLGITIEVFVEKTGENEWKIFAVWNNETVGGIYYSRG